MSLYIWDGRHNRILANDSLSNRLDGDAGHGDDRCKIFVWSGAAKG